MNRRRVLNLVSLCSLALATPAYGTMTFVDFVDHLSRTYGVPDSIIFGMIYVESAGNPDAVGRHGEVGLMQIKHSTARDVLGRKVSRKELFNSWTNVRAGIAYLAHLRTLFGGDLKIAIIAYNRGPGSTLKVLRKGKNPSPKYYRKVTTASSRFAQLMRTKLMKRRTR